MNHHAAPFLYQAVLLLYICFLYFRMRRQPFRRQPVNQEFRPAKAGLPAEENIKAKPFPFCPCLPVALREFRRPLLPGKRPVHRRIASPIVIRHKNPGIARRLTGPRHLCPFRFPAGAPLRSVKVCLI